MSSVRMCDRCGNLFSERRSGWGTYEGTRITKDEKGIRRSITDVLDSCPECTNPMGPDTEGPSPKLPGQPDYAKIRQLEAELLDNEDKTP